MAEGASTELREREEAEVVVLVWIRRFWWRIVGRVGIHWEFLRLFGGSMGFLRMKKRRRSSEGEEGEGSVDFYDTDGA